MRAENAMIAISTLLFVLATFFAGLSLQFGQEKAQLVTLGSVFMLAGMMTVISAAILWAIRNAVIIKKN